MKATARLVDGIHRMWQTKGLASTLLLPLSWLAHLAVLYKQKRYRKQASYWPAGPRPIVVVGNILVGGTGKTPVVIALTQALRAKGWHPGIVSRGYGVKLEARAKVGQGRLDAAGFGDEPALIARSTGAPLAVHPSRVLAVQALVRAHPEVDVIISDDGLQHLALQRDVEIVVQDARGLGNGRMLPAGPLREPAAKLAQVDYLITNVAASQPAPPPLPVGALQLCMRLQPERVEHLASDLSATWPEWLARHAAGTIAAVAAIGQPDRFFSMLRGHGLRLDAAIALPDHDPYSSSPFTALNADVILITAKDAVKCARFNDPRIWVVNVAPQFSDIGWLDGLNEKLHAITEKKKAGGIKLLV
ncbi:Tetraacyldisaccharide 4'-kinase OS=Eoetvoesiella caeni OX=645616 GN=lpxK PE=3 SV=1 [Eoetvoesiella caeni]|uniref:Tetraacyldisaccharide 4'-kinase n=2 Tax=Eoetvoesiella caeni TaxID=645616 RepID=A0A366HFI7_9BURK|nr:tetraacyldisaccharide 4'-kinase [Eoetvoesiella caeni]MCI2808596.1 tetraacyldisaccharide 4'-kinase [Eoetvoesiella caeni]RBP40884.1 lipid-A-disaccharide kinase [Eoetvoesiella caeni]